LGFQQSAFNPYDFIHSLLSTIPNLSVKAHFIGLSEHPAPEKDDQKPKQERKQHKWKHDLPAKTEPESRGRSVIFHSIVPAYSQTWVVVLIYA
jgi:hypothetical protein